MDVPPPFLGTPGEPVPAVDAEDLQAAHDILTNPARRPPGTSPSDVESTIRKRLRKSSCGEDFTRYGECPNFTSSQPYYGADQGFTWPKNSTSNGNCTRYLITTLLGGGWPIHLRSLRLSGVTMPPTLGRFPIQPD